MVAGADDGERREVARSSPLASALNGIEPSSSAWKAVALPLSYTRKCQEPWQVRDLRLLPCRAGRNGRVCPSGGPCYRSPPVGARASKTVPSPPSWRVNINRLRMTVDRSCAAAGRIEFVDDTWGDALMLLTKKEEQAVRTRCEDVNHGVWVVCL